MQKGGISLYSGGDSLLEINKALVQHRPKRPTEIMTIKVQGREIKMPKLDLGGVVEEDKRDPEK